MILECIKRSDDWYSLGNELGYEEDEIYTIFEHGEYGSVEFNVDEKLNIVSGRIIPFKE